jgi:hypothetical protein
MKRELESLYIWKSSMFQPHQRLTIKNGQERKEDGLLKPK